MQFVCKKKCKCEVESIPRVKALIICLVINTNEHPYTSRVGTCLYSVSQPYLYKGVPVLTSLFTLGMASWPPLSH